MLVVGGFVKNTEIHSDRDLAFGMNLLGCMERAFNPTLARSFSPNCDDTEIVSP